MENLLFQLKRSIECVIKSLNVKMFVLHHCNISDLTCQKRKAVNGMFTVQSDLSNHEIASTIRLS